MCVFRYHTHVKTVKMPVLHGYFLLSALAHFLDSIQYRKRIQGMDGSQVITIRSLGYYVFIGGCSSVCRNIAKPNNFQPNLHHVHSAKTH